MAADQIIDDIEEQLYFELVVHIAVRLYEIHSQSPVSRETTELEGYDIDDMALVDFKNACSILMEAGVVDQHPKFTIYRAKFNIPEMRDFLRSNPRPSAESLQSALSCFLAIASDYGRFHPISIAKEPFKVTDGFEKLFQLLEVCGYAQRKGNFVQWTDKVAPAMYAAYLWEDPVVAAKWQRINEAFDKELEAIWDTMPAEICAMFFSADHDQDDELGQVIARFWRDGKWHAKGLDIDRIELSRQRRCVLFAREILKRFHKSERRQ